MQSAPGTPSPYSQTADRRREPLDREPRLETGRSGWTDTAGAGSPTASPGPPSSPGQWAVRVQGVRGLRLRPVVILHEGKPERERVVDILDEVLGKLRRSGYRAVTVSELLSLSG